MKAGIARRRNGPVEARPKSSFPSSASVHRFQVEQIGASATLSPGLITAIVHRCTNAGEFCMSPGKSQKVSRPARPSGLQLRSTCRFGISRSGLTSAFSGNEKAL